jgi:DNA-3-methyladenine glycosylase I
MTDKRCPWCLSTDEYIRYHDEEWGVPSFDEKHLFEMLLLEGAQAGLSWLTILRKREGYRRALHGFDAMRIARYGEKDIARLLADPGIVRNRLKVKAAVDNARAYLEVESSTGFAPLLWSFVNDQPIQNHWKRMDQVPASTPQSDAMSRELKKRGFRFVGSTICYAFMQSVGMVNDHLVSCPRHAAVAAMGDTDR